MPVYTRSGIPAHRRLCRVINTNSYYIGSTIFFEVFSNVITDSNKPIGSVSQEISVDPDIAVHVNTIEFYHYFFRCIGRYKTFAVPSDAMNKIAGIPVTGRRWIYCAFNTPIVWKGKSAPLTIIKCWFFGSCIITRPEPPVFIKRNDRTRICITHDFLAICKKNKEVAAQQKQQMFNRTQSNR